MIGAKGALNDIKERILSIQLINTKPRKKDGTSPCFGIDRRRQEVNREVLFII
jgi:hypothetical protein